MAIRYEVRTNLPATRVMEIVRSQLRAMCGDVAAICRESLLASKDLDGSPLRVPQRLMEAVNEWGEWEGDNADAAATVRRQRKGGQKVFGNVGLGGPGIDSGAMLNMLSTIGATASVGLDFAWITLAGQRNRQRRNAYFLGEGVDGKTDPSEYLPHYEQYTSGKVFGMNLRTIGRMHNRLRQTLGAA